MTAADAQRMVACYAMRWRIEMLFRVLKSGCKVEDRQVQTVEKLKAFIALDLVIACRLLAMTMQARSKPEEPAERWLAREEWEALCVQSAGGGAAPVQCPSIKDAVLIPFMSFAMALLVTSFGIGGMWIRSSSLISNRNLFTPSS